MPEYIEREAMWKEYLKFPIFSTVGGVFVDAYRVQEAIKTLPAADVVEVVRCGECKHFHEYPYRGTSDPSGWGKCKQIDMDIDLTINDFCSYGERKEGAEE